MILGKGDTHFELDEFLQYFTIGDLDKKTEKEKQQAEKPWVWYIVAPLFNSFG